MSDGQVFIVDDEDAVRDAIALLVNSINMTPIEYSSATEFLNSYREVHPACIITDVCMGGIDGINLQKELIRRELQLPMIVISGHGDISMAVKMIRRGALNFLEKPFRNHELITQVREAIRLDLANTNYKKDLTNWKNCFNSLTARERQIAQLLVQGFSNKRIAPSIHLSQRTVETHRSNLLKKMNCPSVTVLTKQFYKFESP